MENIRDQDLKRFAEQKIESLRRELRKWYSVIEALDESYIRQPDLFEEGETKPVVKPAKRSIRIKENPTSLRERCEKILYDLNEPLTTRDLKDIVEKRFNQKYNFNSFSGGFSQSYRRKSSFIKKYDLQNPAKGIISVYGLKEWFNPLTGDLEPEYLNKVFKRYGAK